MERGGEFHWKDLGSTNGTILNGSRMLEGRLRPGDFLQIGEAVIRFEVEEVPDEPPPTEDSTLFKQTIIDDQGQPSTRMVRGRAEDLLRAVYAVTNEIASNYEPCSLIDRLLETTVQAVGAERGALFFAEPGSDELASCPMCGRIHLFDEGELRRVAPNELLISQTVAKRVLEGGESVLFRESDRSGIDASASIVSLKLHSVLCAPLRGKFRTLGILYLDTSRADRQYTDDDMLLATAVGKSAGLAIENANLHRDILEKQRIEQEIQFAWTIQQGFLVKSWPEDEPRFQVYGETRPAKTVGGDFYDIARPDANHVGILIGDVSGKGVPAALTMAQLLAEFRLRAQGVQSPAEVIAALNKDLAARSRHGMFCTMCYMCIDLETGKARLANAGHHPAALITADGVRLFGDASGPPAGVLGDATWQDFEIQLSPGDSVLMYTDGIVEARESNGGPSCEYGAERLSEMAAGFHGKAPKELVEALNRAVLDYCSPGLPHDDCTAIALRYLE
jgi:sigma-B regulation protein RsbU (phosphoserine phosphatase)